MIGQTCNTARGTALLLGAIALGIAQKLPAPTRVWSVTPLAKGEPTVGITVGPGGATLQRQRVDPQTGSVFAATRSVAFAGDRVVLGTMTGMRRLDGAQVPESVYQLLSLDVRTGELKDTREVSGLTIFGTNDAHVIVSGQNVLRLTPDLKDAGIFDYHATGNRFGRVQNISPDGSTLGNATSPGFELIDARTLTASKLTDLPLTDTSVSSKAAVSDSPWWIKDYPKAKSFVTLTDGHGQHLIFHGDCGGRPQFLRDDRVLTAACKVARILDTQGNIIKTITLRDPISFAGVSQNGKRFALQVARFSVGHLISHETFIVYSVDTGEPIAEVAPDSVADEQSWTSFSPDGSMIAVGSPQRLTLFRLP